MKSSLQADVLVLGGGPAGSTAATLLAREGVATVVLESESFPRFHIGESLLPSSLPMLDRLGVHRSVRSLPHTRHKEGATFVDGNGEHSVSFWFDEATAPRVTHSYQVRRDEFDAVLLGNARAAGADVRQGWEARQPLWEGQRLAGVVARPPSGDEVVVRARVVIDASGQSAFLATRMGWRFPYPRHRKVAANAHFSGVELPTGRGAGNIVVVLCNRGWAWLIPFADATVSVGAVLDVEAWREAAHTPESLLEAVRAETPALAHRLAGARADLPFRAVQNFSYRVLHLAGDGYCLVGDASGFLDPIFSTGVFLAMTTAASAAEDILDGLRRHGRLDAEDFAPTVTTTRSMHRLYFSLIRAFYDPDFLAFFFAPTPARRVREAMVSILAGDILGPGRWRRMQGFRALQALSVLQGLGRRWGHPLVKPLPGRFGA